MKRRLYAIAVLCLCLSCTAACGKVADMTPEQNEQVAEYIASRILKYDVNYQEPVLEYDEAILEVTPTPKPTPTPTPKPEEKKEDGEESASGGSIETGAGASTAAALSSDLSAVCGGSKYVVKPRHYELKQTYKDVFADVEALDGKKLLILTFQVKNLTKKQVKADILSKKLSFRLEMDGDYISPLHSLISNDLQYYEAKLPAGKSKQAVLLFEIDKKSKPDKAVLIAEAGGKSTRVGVDAK